MTDLVFFGGFQAMNVGSQQFTSRNLTFFKYVTFAVSLEALLTIEPAQILLSSSNGLGVGRTVVFPSTIVKWVWICPVEESVLSLWNPSLFSTALSPTRRLVF